jgi:hypothetical protein
MGLRIEHIDDDEIQLEFYVLSHAKHQR